MPGRRLTKDEIVTIHILSQANVANTTIAEILQTSESVIRYQKGKGPPETRQDGRRKVFLIDQRHLTDVVRTWYNNEVKSLKEGQAVNGKALWEKLVQEYEYPGSEKSVRKYLRHRFPRPRLRTYRRVETPPGAQTQSDWVEYRDLDIGLPIGPTTVYAFLMKLSYSRKQAVVWSSSCDQVSWHHCHNEAFRRLGGVAAVNRIDNLKTGVSQGGGAWGEINPQYRRYAQEIGFHVDACAPRQPQQKGKVERGGLTLRQMGVERRRWINLEELQAFSDAQIEVSESRRICPSTGETIAATWERERRLLRPLPETIPEPFDLVKTVMVHKDCMVHFEGRQYAVPFVYAGLTVEVRGCAGVVQIMDVDTGAVVKQYPRHTARRLLIDPDCYEGENTDRVLAPVPLGAMAQRLADLGGDQVERRSVDWYAMLAEVAR